MLLGAGLMGINTIGPLFYQSPEERPPGGLSTLEDALDERVSSNWSPTIKYCTHILTVKYT